MLTTEQMFLGEGTVHQNPSCPEVGEHIPWIKAVGRAGCFLHEYICSNLTPKEVRVCR
ncbi:MAG: hypothetical protein ACYDEJ_13925 [Desulfitobacteriaceae bacterium]